MKCGINLEYTFVDTIPDELEERRIYVCIRFSTVLHKVRLRMWK